MKFTFEPSKKIRSFDSKLFEEKQVTLKLEEVKDGCQMVSIESPLFREFELRPWGWVERVLGEKGTTIKRKISSVSLLESMNGGRSSEREYPSYKAYFNEETKKTVQQFWRGGLMGRLFSGSGGDPDEADIIVKFKDFQLEDHCVYGFKAPEEWYSEMHRDEPQFKFERGFYKDADEAIHFFSDKAQDDIFGTRYFPVLVFPKNTTVDVRGIVHYAKNYSKPIVTDKHIIFGTRCKPDEMPEVIKDTYDNGGQIARGQQWDWGS
jgi:hypothetical protein